jgi:uncharacterized protein (DUF2236 family)
VQGTTPDERWQRIRAAVEPRAAGGVEGLFGPRSMMWRVCRELAVALGGPRALLLQIAHPAIAAAVERHSSFRQDPLGRGSRTLEMVFEIVFAERERALDLAGKLYKRHVTIRGDITETSRSPWSARPYDALDPVLLTWVWATIMDTAVLVFREMVEPLDAGELARFYDDARFLAEVFGIPPDAVPRDWPAFEAYFDDAVNGATLNVGPIARAQADALTTTDPSNLLGAIYGIRAGLRARPWADNRPLRTLSSRFSRVLAAGMLPARLRDDFGLPWRRPERAAYRALVLTVRRAVPRLPPKYRLVPGFDLIEARFQ